MNHIEEFVRVARRDVVEEAIKYLNKTLKEHLLRETKDKLNSQFPEYSELTESITEIRDDSTADEYERYCSVDYLVCAHYREIKIYFHKNFYGEYHHVYFNEDIAIDLYNRLGKKRHFQIRKGGESIEDVEDDQTLLQLVNLLEIPKDNIIAYISAVVDCPE